MPQANMIWAWFRSSVQAESPLSGRGGFDLWRLSKLEFGTFQQKTAQLTYKTRKQLEESPDPQRRGSHNLEIPIATSPRPHTLDPR